MGGAAATGTDALNVTCKSTQDVRGVTSRLDCMQQVKVAYHVLVFSQTRTNPAHGAVPPRGGSSQEFHRHVS